MSACIALLLLCQATLGPLDAYEANHASIKAKTTFTMDSYNLARSTLPKVQDRFSPGLIISAKPRFRGRGRWECDGDEEHFITEVVETKMTSPDGKPTNFINPREVLLDRELVVYRELENPANAPLSARPYQRSTQMPISLFGPLRWWGICSLPEVLAVEYQGIQPQRYPGRIDGSPVEIEVYTSKIEEGLRRAEVSYDPAMGYLPRHFRLVFISTQPGKDGWVKEGFILAARPCAAGGFVPTEWYDTSYRAKRRELDDPKYSAETPLTPSGKCSLLHFKTESFEDLQAPIVFGRVPEPVTFMNKENISAEGLTQPFTLDALKQRLRTGKPGPGVMLPNLAAPEPVADAPQPAAFGPHYGHRPLGEHFCGHRHFQVEESSHAAVFARVYRLCGLSRGRPREPELLV